MARIVELVLPVHSGNNAAVHKSQNACGKELSEPRFSDLWSAHKSLTSQEKNNNVTTTPVPLTLCQEWQCIVNNTMLYQFVWQHHALCVVLWKHQAVSVYVVLWRTTCFMTLVWYCEQHHAVSVYVVLWRTPYFMTFVWYCEQHQAVSVLCVVLWKRQAVSVCVVLWEIPCFMCGIVNHTKLCLVWFVLQQVMYLTVCLLALTTVEVPPPLSHPRPLCKWWNHYTEWLDKQLFENTLRAMLWEGRCLWMSYITCFWRL